MGQHRISDRRAGSAIQATFRFKLLTGSAVRLMLGPVTDGIILTVKNDSVIGDNMGFLDDGLTSHSGFREQGRTVAIERQGMGQ